jgi:hypothetical protein
MVVGPTCQPIFYSSLCSLSSLSVLSLPLDGAAHTRTWPVSGEGKEVAVAAWRRRSCSVAGIPRRRTSWSRCRSSPPAISASALPLLSLPPSLSLSRDLRRSSVRPRPRSSTASTTTPVGEHQRSSSSARIMVTTSKEGGASMAWEVRADLAAAPGVARTCRRGGGRGTCEALQGRLLVEFPPIWLGIW